MIRFGDFGFHEILGRNYQIGNYYVAMFVFVLAPLVSILAIRRTLAGEAVVRRVNNAGRC